MERDTLLAAWMFAPLSSSSWTISRRPFEADRIKAVFPSCNWGSETTQHGGLNHKAHVLRLQVLTWLAVSTAAIASRSNFATGIALSAGIRLADAWRGVQPICEDAQSKARNVSVLSLIG